MGREGLYAVRLCRRPRVSAADAASVAQTVNSRRLAHGHQFCGLSDWGNLLPGHQGCGGDEVDLSRTMVLCLSLFGRVCSADMEAHNIPVSSRKCVAHPSQHALAVLPGTDARTPLGRQEVPEILSGLRRCRRDILSASGGRWDIRSWSDGGSLRRDSWSVCRLCHSLSTIQCIS